MWRSLALVRRSLVRGRGVEGRVHTDLRDVSLERGTATVVTVVVAAVREAHSKAHKRAGQK